MPIVGIGIDVIRISRIEATMNRFGQRFLKRMFHPSEIETSAMRVKSAEYLAGCFAVKEACLKALGDFPGRGIAWFDMYITHEPSGKPVLHLENGARELALEKGVNRYHVTISHDGDFAVAHVILEQV